jgi:hypothetical protein
MWEANRGKMFGATAFSSYGAFWISLGLYGIVSDTGIFAAAGGAVKGLEAVRPHATLPTFTCSWSACPRPAAAKPMPASFIYPPAKRYRW